MSRLRRSRALRLSLIGLAGLVLAFGGWLVGMSSHPDSVTRDPGDVLSVLNRPAGPKDILDSINPRRYDRVRYLGSDDGLSAYVAVDSRFERRDELQICAIMVVAGEEGHSASCGGIVSIQKSGWWIAYSSASESYGVWVLPDGHADEAADAVWATLVHDNAIVWRGIEDDGFPNGEAYADLGLEPPWADID